MEDKKSAEILLHPASNSWSPLACIDSARQHIPASSETVAVLWLDEAGVTRFNLAGKNKDILWMLTRLQHYMMAAR